MTEGKLPPSLEVSGSLAADETSEVAAPGSGVVTKVEVDVGSRVKRGDALVLLDPRTPAAELHALLKPYPADEMEAVPVGRYVSNPRNEGSRCLAP